MTYGEARKAVRRELAAFVRVLADELAEHSQEDADVLRRAARRYEDREAEGQHAA